MRSDYKRVSHPDFEVHNFSSLMEVTGYHATGLQCMYAEGKFEVIATNMTGKVIFAITKDEIARLKAMRANSPFKPVKHSRRKYAGSKGTYLSR